MATEAKVGIIVYQQLFIYGTVGVMANGAAFAHCLMLKDHWSCLSLVTARATLILTGHRQTALSFEDVAPVRVVAIHAIHETLIDRMMLRQIKLPLHVEMALKTRGRVFAGIDDEGGRAATPDMLAARTVAGFATALPCHGGAFDMQARVWAGREFANNIGMAIGARLVAHVVRAGNFQGRNDSE